MQSMTHRSAAEREDGTYACPLCDHRSETTTDVYVHLQVSHRKSEISEALIEAITDDGVQSADVEQ